MSKCLTISKTTVTYAGVEPNLKQEAEIILKSLCLNMTKVI